jgi:GntR family transcriptional repressor for pyruvate dehydrogenase complex
MKMDTKMPKKSVSKQVLEAIENIIRNGEILPGQYLPPERELAARLKVGRPAIREALKALEIIGVAEITQGKGTKIKIPSVDNVFQPLVSSAYITHSDLINFTEARAVLEPKCAYIAATRAKADQLQKLFKSLVKMRNSLNDPEAYNESDLQFHKTIVQATNNPVLVKIYETLAGFVWQLSQETKRLPDLTVGVGFHETLYKAIYNRNAVEAERQMQLHIEDTREKFMEFSGYSKI